jgi:hypothetical protein
MSIIFQLFSAADLQNLSPQQLKQLRDLVRDELETSDKVREALRERANAVFSQLETQRDPDSSEPQPQPQPSPDPLQSLAAQLFDPQEFARLNNDPKLLKILEWAIECERNSSPHVLDAIREKAYEWFQRLPGKSSTLPQPDAEYSPYSENYKAVRVVEPYVDLTLEERAWSSLPANPQDNPDL